MKIMDAESDERNIAIGRVAASSDNNYELILNEARYIIRAVAPGTRIVAGQVLRWVLERRPELKPRDKRVMGGVMPALAKENLIRKSGISTRERSHRGFAQEWRCL